MQGERGGFGCYTRVVTPLRRAPRSTTWLALGLVAVVARVPLGAVVSRQQAEVFERKIEAVMTPRAAASPVRRTPMSEDEINSWFTYNGQPDLPTGIAGPQVALHGEGRFTGRAMLDLDAVGRRRSSGGWLDPWSLLGGRLPIIVTGTLATKNGVGRFMLESATLGGVPMPKLLLQELLTLYTRGAGRPRGFGLDDPFPLPVGIRTIEVGRAAAVVVQ